MFVLLPGASLAYLTSGVRNPTPYDYPLATTFGQDGEDDVVAAARSGRLRRACIAPPRSQEWVGLEPLRPTQLESRLRRAMARERDLSFCVVFRARG